MTRAEFFQKARQERYEWAKKVDPMAVRAFEVACEKRRKRFNGK